MPIIAVGNRDVFEAKVGSTGLHLNICVQLMVPLSFFLQKQFVIYFLQVSSFPVPPVSLKLV